MAGGGLPLWLHFSLVLKNREHNDNAARLYDYKVTLGCISFHIKSDAHISSSRKVEQKTKALLLSEHVLTLARCGESSVFAWY